MKGSQVLLLDVDRRPSVDRWGPGSGGHVLLTEVRDQPWPGRVIKAKHT